MLTTKTLTRTDDGITLTARGHLDGYRVFRGEELVGYLFKDEDDFWGFAMGDERFGEGYSAHPEEALSDMCVSLGMRQSR